MNTRKSIMVVFLVLIIVLAGTVPKAYCQLDDAIKELTGENTKGYLQPFVNTFANNINAGIYHTAKIPTIGFHFYIGLVAMGTTISDDDLVYMGVPPEPYPQDPVETATVFGEEGAIVEGPQGVKYRFQDGQLTGDFIPFAVPQVELGSLFGTVARLRFFSAQIPGDAGEDIGKIKLLGYGLQHSLSQYIPLCPIDLSAGVFYQTFDIGDIMKSKALSYGIQASKSLAILTLYGGAAMESTTMDVSYTYEGEGTEEEIALELKGDTKFRFQVGAALRLAILVLHGQVNIGNQMTYAVGVGFGM